MVSTVMRIDERKDRYEAHVVVGEGSRPGIGRECAIDSTCVLEREIPAYLISKMLRFDLDRVQRIFLAKGLSRIVRPRGGRSAAPAVDALRRNAPAR